MKQSIRTWFSASLVIVATAASIFSASPATAETKPVAVVSLAGYDALISDLNYIGELTGTPQLAQSLEGILALVTRAQGLVGLDKSKPIGAAVSLGEAGNPIPIVFVPVTDSDKLLDALQGLVPTVEDLGDGFTRLKPANGPSVIMTEVDGWAFLSSSKDNLDDLPDDPAKLLGDLAKKYDVAVRVNVQNIPPQFVQIAVQAMKQGAQSGLKQLPDEDDDTYRVRKEFVETYLNQITQLIEEVDQITAGFAIDAESRSSYLDVTLTVTPGGTLAKQLAAAAKNDKGTKFAGLADPKAAANLHFSSSISKEDEAVFLDGLAMARKEAVKKVDESGKIDDVALKQSVQEMLSQVFDVAEATVRGRQFDGGAVMLGEGPFDLVVGGLVVDAKKLEGVVKRAVELFGDEPGIPEIKLDAAEHDGVTFMTITVPDVDEDTAKLFGDELTVAVGFGEDRVLIAAGANPVKTASAVLDKSKKTAKLPPAQMQMKLGPLVRFGAESDEDNRETAEMIADLLEESGKDHFNVTAEFVPNGQRVRFEIEEGVIEAIGKAAVLGMQRGR